jgi:ATP-dependent DNA helicase RecQ
LALSTIHKILQQYWGYQSFRGNQQQIIEAVLEGKNVLAILPTGGGKSICYQIPALVNDGVCIVVSPLLALMKDQVQNLQQKSISAIAITGNLPYQAIEKILMDAVQGKYKFIYTSPERLNTYLYKKYFPQININLIAIDEAHCISQWGHDFRPSYTKIILFFELVNQVPILAVTASATQTVQQDILEQLRLKDVNIFKQTLYKPNISYSAFKTEAKIDKLLNVLKTVQGSSIVYCNNRKQTKKVQQILAEHNITSAFYHAGLPIEQREQVQENWIKNRIRVIVSTNAFGMGIDKPDVRTVIHFDVPENVENYYQEAGRAGRDNAKAYAVVLYNTQDIDKLKKLASVKFPKLEVIKDVYQNIANFLQIPVGTGEDCYYDFDLIQFCKVFNYDVFVVFGALKALEKNGHLLFNEQAFIGSKITFTTDRFTLEQIEIQNPSFDLVIKTLLRSYEGIFDNECVINEKLLAKLCKTNLSTIIQILNQLHLQRILQYNPSKSSPQLYFNFNRASASYIQFNEHIHQQQRNVFEQKTHAMINYVISTTKCRNELIQHYFDDENPVKCGVCDNCLAQKQQPLNAQKFEEIQHKIVQSNFPILLVDLLANLKQYNKNHNWQVIRFLEDKKLIQVQRDGVVKKLIN